jgi:hypothetical protein
MTPREGGTAAAGHTKLYLHYTYITVGPKRHHQVYGRTRGGSREIPEGPEGTRGDPRDTRSQKDRRAHGECKRHQEDRRETRGDRSGP